MLFALLSLQAVITQFSLLIPVRVNDIEFLKFVIQVSVLLAFDALIPCSLIDLVIYTLLLVLPILLKILYFHHHLCILLLGIH